MKKRWFLGSLMLCAFVIQSEKRPQTNGVIDANEWIDATTHELANGNKIMLLREENTLYAALTGPSSFWAHLYLSDGNVIKVMHVSAALDDVTYKKGSSSWTTSDTFEYEMRDKVFNEETRKKMKAYLDNHGWVANNINMANGKVVEAELDLSVFKGPLYFASVIATANDGSTTMTHFPSTVSDNTILLRLVQGYTPDSLNFKPETWHQVSSK
jgi:hypothetical protein